MPKKLLDSAAPPIQDKILDARGLISDAWRNWFGRMPDTLAAIPSILNTVQLSAQAASIGATNFAGTELLAGLYRASYQAQITQAATVASSLIVTFSWTNNGVAQAAVSTAIVGNTTSTGQSDSVLLTIDAGTSVYYSTTYVSVGATAMEYALNVLLERVKV